MGEVAGEKVLTVLLVEADDSTRSIIAALLRKCSYTVAAVSDGLKAWETLENNAHGIDLILTELELPSISGFSLLTLIMERDVCKNIPVIISMVFECMLKGAADFLLKPVRRNELRNLWHHVWRRNAIRSCPQNLTSPQNKLEVAVVENNAAKSISTGFVASAQKNHQCSEKTSEAQDTSQLKSSSNLSNIDTVKHEESTKFGKESAKHNNEGGEKSVIFASEAAKFNKTFKSKGLRLDQGYDCTETENLDEGLRTELSRAKPRINTEIHGCSDQLVEPSTSREAMDLIAMFENFSKSTDENCSFNGGDAAKFDFDTQLELSLSRDFPSSSCKPETEDMQTLNHSNASAFSWYSSGKLLLQPQNLSENANTSHQYSSKNKNQENMTTLVIGQSGQIERKLPNSQLGFFPAAGVTSDHKSTGHGNVSPSMFYTQSGIHPILTPKPVYQKESSPFPTSTSSLSNPESHNLECRHRSDDSTYTSDQNVNDQRKLDCARLDSPTACSDGNDTSAAVAAKNNPETLTDSCHPSYDGFIGTDSPHTSQREVALTKFRLKRKNRCYEKKVRYQSRKRLAELRPRVKGQFVRQVHNDHPVVDAGGS